MTTTEAGWEWQDGTLYRRRPRRWIPSAVLYGVQALALLLLPAIFLVPAILTLSAASWGWSTESCVVTRRDGVPSCGAAWAFMIVGGAILTGWVVAVAMVVRVVLAQRKQIETPMHLDARFLHAAVPPSLMHGPARISIRWEDLFTIEPSARGPQTLLLRLVAGADVVTRDRVARDKPLLGADSCLTVECGEAAVDAPVLRYFLSDISRWGLTTQEGAAHALRVAGLWTNLATHAIQGDVLFFTYPERSQRARSSPSTATVQAGTRPNRHNSQEMGFHVTTDSLAGLISWIIIGLVCGAIARAVLPGRAGGGWLTSLVIGVIGALIGGYIGRVYFGASTNENLFDVGTWLWAFLGSLLVLAIWGAVAGNRSRRSHSRSRR